MATKDKKKDTTKKDKKNPHIEYKGCVELLQVELTDEEVIRSSREGACAFQDMEAIEAQLDAYKKEMKAKIDQQVAIITKCNLLITNGYENREVKCKWKYNFKTGKKVLTRLDTKEEIRHEEIQPHERQTTLLPEKDKKKDELAEKREKKEKEYEKFLKFHEEKPQVYKLFIKFALEAFRAGHEGYSAKTIFEVIRWHSDIEIRPNESFKLNNNYTAYYARMAMKDYPGLSGFFETRETIN